MARAFKFLKSTSVSCGAPVEGFAAGVTEEESAGDADTGEALGDSVAAGETGGGVSSWASETDTAKVRRQTTRNKSRTIIGRET